MSGQRGLFDEPEDQPQEPSRYWSDTPEGRELLGRLWANSDDDWQRKAIRAALNVGATYPRFTADQIAAAMGEAPSRRMGGLMLRLYRAGAIEPVDRTTGDRVRRISHGAPVTIWTLKQGGAA